MYFVSFQNAFHGRAMGAQLAGGSEKSKAWMVDRDATFVQAPFPDVYKSEDTSFDLFLRTLKEKGVQPRDIAGVMTETYQGGGPDFLQVAAAIASLEIIQKEHLAERAARPGEILIPELHRLQQKYPKVLACVHGKGLVAGIQVVKPGTKTPDPDTALKINIACVQKGLLTFAPVGAGGECIKIAPRLRSPKRRCASPFRFWKRRWTRFWAAGEDRTEADGELVFRSPRRHKRVEVHAGGWAYCPLKMRDPLGGIRQVSGAL
jgi:4-aminobutyrate aminotransferase-like enzyme